MRILSSLMLPVMLLPGVDAGAGDFSGNVSMEYRRFFSEKPLEEPARHSTSLALEPGLTHAWLGGDLQLDVEGFWRGGSSDEKRDHGDIRVLSLNYAAESYELRAGIRKVFWGVTESRHLVDIINQTDQLEGFDGEDKLGQAMLNLALIGDAATLDVFVLPGFRERAWPAAGSRPGPGLPVAAEDTLYESADEERHVDYALRCAVTLGDWDLGLSWFRGTGREPRLLPQLAASGPVLIPYYYIIEQTGVDLQATLGNWLWKLEAIHQNGLGEDYAAAVAGFEYSFFDIRGSGADLGLILEYLHDDRNAQATTPFENDLMLGARLALNDVQSSEALLGIIRDLDSNEYLLSMELSRRLGRQWKVGLEAYGFGETERDSLMSGFERDDFVQVNVFWYF